MSQPDVTIRSDRYTQMVAQGLKAGFLDKDFIMTMRFSELNGTEEYDNAMAYAMWHGYLETGIQQVKAYVDMIDDTKRNTEEWSKVPKDQQERIAELLTKFKTYDNEKPVDDKENIRIIRNHLQWFNENLMDGVMFYDIHIAILNGRYAKGRQGKKEIIEVTKTVLNRDYEIQMAQAQSQDDRNWLRKKLHV